jgi:hypothetical protein
VIDPDAGRSFGAGGCSVREARPREPKTATVKRREASVPRHGTQGASPAVAKAMAGLVTRRSASGGGSQAPGVPRHKRVYARL